jgi:uncharacterized membrane protein
MNPQLQQEKKIDPTSESAERLEARTHSQKSKPHYFSVTIGKPVEEVFQFWRNFQNLPFFMKDLSDVQVLSDKKSHWTVEVKAGLKFEWDAVITDEIPGEMITWKSMEGSSVQTNGTVTFEKAPADRGTIVHLAMQVHVPGSKASELAGKFTGEDPHNLTLTNLRRLKAYLETGVIPTTEGQASGREADQKEKTHLH